jgi:hypothetical protein
MEEPSSPPILSSLSLSNPANPFGFYDRLLSLISSGHFLSFSTSSSLSNYSSLSLPLFTLLPFAFLLLCPQKRYPSFFLSLSLVRSLFLSHSHHPSSYLPSFLPAPSAQPPAAAGGTQHGAGGSNKKNAALPSIPTGFRPSLQVSFGNRSIYQLQRLLLLL